MGIVGEGRAYESSAAESESATNTETCADHQGRTAKIGRCAPRAPAASPHQSCWSHGFPSPILPRLAPLYWPCAAPCRKMGRGGTHAKQQRLQGSGSALQPSSALVASPPQRSLWSRLPAMEATKPFTLGKRSQFMAAASSGSVRADRRRCSGCRREANCKPPRFRAAASRAQQGWQRPAAWVCLPPARGFHAPARSPLSRRTLAARDGSRALPVALATRRRGTVRPVHVLGPRAPLPEGSQPAVRTRCSHPHPSPRLRGILLCGVLTDLAGLDALPRPAARFSTPRPMLTRPLR